ncbi:MAG: phosphate ABC transporter permease PstA [Solirubrobacteraceae bacterium]
MSAPTFNEAGLRGLPPVSPGRVRKDRIARTFIGALTLIALVPLVLVVFYLLKQGLGAWNGDFFTTDPTGRTCFPGQTTCSIGGVRSAILGTLEIVALASVIAIPFGTAVAVYLVEYGKQSKFANTVRYFVDVMTGVPSVAFGLFVYIVLVASGLGGSYAGWKGSVALALLMLPIVVRSSEVVLNLVPNQLRESALALGAPRWKVIWSVVLPTARSGLITGSLLAVARAAGETAPLLFTAFATNELVFGLGQPMNSLPLQIFNDVRTPQDAIVQRAWGAALFLVLLILILNLVARLAQRRSRLA